jgi:hypothetical protein
MAAIKDHHPHVASRILFIEPNEGRAGIKYEHCMEVNGAGMI